MVSIILNDCKRELAFMKDNSVDAVVTDPPYEINMMGRKWDGSGIAYDVELWAEVLRVLKPGGHLLSFGATRTHHRMMVAIEDAGFEIRECLMWVFGSGFPKSQSISKMIDKKLGRERKIVGRNPNSRESCDKTNTLFESGTVGKTAYITEPASEEAKEWEGWGTTLKPAYEPIVLARKPLREKTVVANVLKHGVGGINIDGCRILSGDTAKGRFPANILFDEDAAEILDNQAPTTGNGHWPNKTVSGYGTYGGGKSEYQGVGQKEYGTGASRFFYCAKASKKEKNEGLEIPNTHLTVKPLALMEYLITLITPTNGLVLDPFMGSGSTGCAAIKNGFDFIGIELEEESYQVAKKRIEYHQNEYQVLNTSTTS